MQQTASRRIAFRRVIAAKRSAERRNAQFEDAIDQIRQALQGLRYGEVSVVVQDGVVVQLERRERKRLRGAQP